MKKYNLFLLQFWHNFLWFLCYAPIIILLIIFVFESCQTTKKGMIQKQRVEMVSDNDSTEYTLIVLDPGYDSYLATQPPSNFYSQQYYENWNNQYVIEWNARYRNPLRFGGFYETEIDYNLREDYGLDLNYRLYYYFQFIKDKYGIVLVNRGR
ncbi:MAG: DUF6146 family protein [Candidatus Saccharimonadaceae bacterium]